MKEFLTVNTSEDRLVIINPTHVLYLCRGKTCPPDPKEPCVGITLIHLITGVSISTKDPLSEVEYAWRQALQTYRGNIQ